MTEKNLKASYKTSAAEVLITPNDCGENTIAIFSRTQLDVPLITAKIVIVPPRAVVEAIVSPEGGFITDTKYQLKMKYSDENAAVGYSYTVEGGDYTMSNDRVTFNKDGEYKVRFTSSYYPDDVYEFTLIVLNPQKEAAIRKQIGHFGMFGILGVFGLLSFGYFIKKFPYKAIITAVAGFTVAAVSEIFQLPVFTNARGSSVGDIFIDFSGYLLGAALTLGILFVVYKIISRRRASSPTEQ